MNVFKCEPETQCIYMQRLECVNKASRKNRLNWNSKILCKLNFIIQRLYATKSTTFVSCSCSTLYIYKLIRDNSDIFTTENLSTIQKLKYRLCEKTIDKHQYGTNGNICKVHTTMATGSGCPIDPQSISLLRSEEAAAVRPSVQG